MSDILQRILRDLRDKQATADSAGLPTARIQREPSPTERNAPYLPVNYGLLFCCHSKSYFDVCASCKRTRKDAKRQYEVFCFKNEVDTNKPI